MKNNELRRRADGCMLRNQQYSPRPAHRLYKSEREHSDMIISIRMLD